MVKKKTQAAAGKPVEAPAWHHFASAECAARLGSDAAQGLREGQARENLAKHGANELTEKPRTPFLVLLLDQFKDFLILILVAAAVISIFLGEYVDAVVILLIVVLNGVLGVIQESKAEAALAALKKMAAPDARVIRGGHTLVVPSRELVPGDVVLLEAGNFVPADVRLVETANLRVEEASLTGESVPVEKRCEEVLEEKASLGDRINMAYMSTMVSFGRGRGIVVGTGMNTQIGLIAAMLQEDDKEETPLQKKLDQMGKWLGIGALGICAIVFLAGVLEGRNVLEMFMTSVSLAIAAVPEGLPAVVTICLALGMQEMVKRHALIRKLPAVETLGSTTIICSDKTGTLTQNQMTVCRVWTDGDVLDVSGEGYRPEGEVLKGRKRAELKDYSTVRLLLQGALLCNDAHLEMMDDPTADGGKRWRMVGDPTEGALVVAAAKTDLFAERVEKHYPREAEIPFDAERKRMTTIHGVPAATDLPKKEAVRLDIGTPYVAFTKGAPDLTLQQCSAVMEKGKIRRITDADRTAVMAANSAFASQALRVLAVAMKPIEVLPENPSVDEVEKDLVLLGLAGMIDPARPEATRAIETARQAGIKVIMVTGDHKDTAAAIGRDIGLLSGGEGAISGAEIDAISDADFPAVVERTAVFARVSPQHKVRIVEAARKNGHVVGMTGDGVNDAPALKKADIGIAMGITGTDVTKQTADMVLTDDNFASIISAVEQGRIIFSNIRKFVYYLMSCNLGEIGTLFFGTLFGWPLPLSAIQLLWTNLITDGAPALALGLEKGEPDMMKRPPRPTKEPIINGSMRVSLVLQFLAITGATLLAFWLGWKVFGASLGTETAEHLARTMAFVTLSGCQLIRAYTNRSERASLFQIGPFSNKWMQYAVISSMALLLATIYIPGLNTGVFATVPLTGSHWLCILPLMLLPAVVDEVTKLVIRLSERKAAH